MCCGEHWFLIGRKNTWFSGTDWCNPSQTKNLKTQIDGLYVGDASVIPVSPGKPPILLILALAERLANHLIDEVI